MIDENKDGFITEMEFNSVCCVPFKLLDKDGDGKISREEWDAGFSVFDIDGDGSITKSEFHIVAGYDFVFELLDADNDEQISLKEYRRKPNICTIHIYISPAIFNKHKLRRCSVQASCTWV
jgi:Ca2+-binding EF-hand superfamily protein